MYLINTTFQADIASAPGLLDFLDEYVAKVEKMTGLHSRVLSRMTSHADDESAGTETYALQFRVPSRKELVRYTGAFLPVMDEVLTKRFGRGVVHFTTVLEILK